MNGTLLAARASNAFYGVDFAILATSAVFPAALGLYFCIRDRGRLTAIDFFLGEGRESAMVVGISLAMSYISPLIILGHSGEVYGRGFLPSVRGFGLVLGFLFSALVVIKVLKPLGFGSPNEYLWHRFRSPFLAVIGTVISVVGTCAFNGAGLAAASLAVSTATASKIPPLSALLAGGIAAVACAALGGLRAIMWSSVVQVPLLLITMATFVILAFTRAGGFWVAMETSSQYQRLHEAYMSLDPRVSISLPGLVLFGALDWATRAILPASIQRLSAVRTSCGVRRAFLLASTLLLVLFWLSSLAGLAVFAFYAGSGCDPRSSGLERDLLVTPLFARQQMHQPGLLGLFTAVIFTAGLASLAAAVSGAASALWHDIGPFCCTFSSENTSSLTPKLLTLTMGAAVVAFGCGCLTLDKGYFRAVVTISNALLGPYLAVFCLGLLFPSANKVGAIAGLLAGLSCCLGFNIEGIIHPVSFKPLPTNTSGCPAVPKVVPMEAKGTAASSFRVSEPWSFTFGVLATIFFGLFASACSATKREVEERFLCRPKKPNVRACCIRCCCYCCRTPGTVTEMHLQPKFGVGSEDQITEL